MSMDPFLDTLAHVEDGRTLSRPQAAAAMRAIMDGHVPEDHLARWLGALALRVPTSQELLGFVAAAMSTAVRVPCRTPPERILDTCGTGGAPKVFNASTLAGLVAAASGCPVAKHGNRSRTSFGSAETLAALGVRVDATPEDEARLLDEIGFCFCMAPSHHPGAAHAATVRRKLGIPTVFNVVGPLCNPAGALRQVVGVWDERLLMPVAETLAAMGSVQTMVLHGMDGLDEVSVTHATRYVHVERGVVAGEGMLEPAMFGIRAHAEPPEPAHSLVEAVEIANRLLDGRDVGARRDMLVANAAVALVVGGHRLSWKDAASMARDLLDSRRVRILLDRLVEQEKRP